ncbi:MAG: hypothetical protein ABEK50_00225 [bacterium]
MAILLITMSLSGCGGTDLTEQDRELRSSIEKRGLKVQNFRRVNNSLKFTLFNKQGEGFGTRNIMNLKNPNPSNPEINKVVGRLGMILGLLTRQFKNRNRGTKDRIELMEVTIPDHRKKKLVILKINQSSVSLAENMRTMSKAKKGRLFQEVLQFNPDNKAGRVLKEAIEEAYGVTL